MKHFCEYLLPHVIHNLVPLNLLKVKITVSITGHFKDEFRLNIEMEGGMMLLVNVTVDCFNTSLKFNYFNYLHELCL